MTITKDGSQIAIAAASDDNYVIPLCVSLHSLIASLSTGESVGVFVLSLGISDANKEKLKTILSRKDVSLTLMFVDVELGKVAALPELNHLSIAAYLRLLLPDLLPQDCEKVLYVDSDILVRKSVRPLWDLDVGEFDLLAAQDVELQTVSNPQSLYNWKELGFDEQAPSFNSGILLINLKRWREQGLSEVLLQYAADHREHLHWADQDVLNAVCGKCWGQLDLTWNMQAVNLQTFPYWPESPLKEKIHPLYEELWSDPAICHFVSQHKPWLAKHKPPFQHEWLDAFKATGWYTNDEYNQWLNRFKITNFVYAIRWQVVSKLTRQHV